jgi:hypothetical protein
MRRRFLSLLAGLPILGMSSAHRSSRETPTGEQEIKSNNLEDKSQSKTADLFSAPVKKTQRIFLISGRLLIFWSRDPLLQIA